MSNTTGTSWGVLALAALVVALVGSYALIYPNSPVGQGAILALLPIAGAISQYFFHSQSTAFLGQQIQAAQNHQLGMMEVLAGEPAISRYVSPTTPSATTGSPTPAAPGPASAALPTTTTSQP